MEKVVLMVSITTFVVAKQLLLIQETFRHGARYPLFFE
jgi:hypothetical protein